MDLSQGGVFIWKLTSSLHLYRLLNRFSGLFPVFSGECVFKGEFILYGEIDSFIFATVSCQWKQWEEYSKKPESVTLYMSDAAELSASAPKRFNFFFFWRNALCIRPNLGQLETYFGLPPPHIWGSRRFTKTVVPYRTTYSKTYKCERYAFFNWSSKPNKKTESNKPFFLVKLFATIAKIRASDYPLLVQTFS